MLSLRLRLPRQGQLRWRKSLKWRCSGVHENLEERGHCWMCVEEVSLTVIYLACVVETRLLGGLCAGALLRECQETVRRARDRLHPGNVYARLEMPAIGSSALITADMTARHLFTLSCLTVMMRLAPRYDDIGDLSYAQHPLFFDTRPVDQLGELERNSPNLRDETDPLWKKFVAAKDGLMVERVHTGQEEAPKSWRKLYKVRHRLPRRGFIRLLANAYFPGIAYRTQRDGAQGTSCRRNETVVRIRARSQARTCDTQDVRFATRAPARLRDWWSQRHIWCQADFVGQDACASGD